jgi:hypothetical protein
MRGRQQRCQRIYFQTKNWGKFLTALDWKMLIYFWTFGILTDIWDIYDHLVHFVFIWYISSGFLSRIEKNLATLLG